MNWKGAAMAISVSVMGFFGVFLVLLFFFVSIIFIYTFIHVLY